MANAEAYARLERLSRYLSHVALREGCSAHYDRILAVYIRERAKVERMRDEVAA